MGKAPGLPEAQSLVERHAGGVLRGDAAVHRAHPLEPQQIEQGAVQPGAQPPAGRPLAEVHRQLGAPLVGGAGGVGVGVGVAQQGAVLLPHQVGEAGGGVLDAAGELLQRGDVVLKGDDGAGNIRGIDFQEAGGVLGRGETEHGKPSFQNYFFQGQKYSP